MRGKKMNCKNRRGFALSGALFTLVGLSLSDTAWGQPSVTATPTTLNFTGPANAVLSGCNSANTCAVHVTGVSVGTVGIQLGNNSQWIRVTPPGLNLPGDLSVSVDTSQLPAGGSTGSFIIYSSSNFSIQQTITVNATVSGNSQLSATPTSVTFNGQVGASFGTPQSCPIQNSPASCQITVISSGPQLTYNITPSTQDGNPWLIVDATSGRTNGTPLNVAVNPSAVPNAGTYMGQILFQSTTTGDSAVVSITMVVSATPSITATPAQLNFFYTTGGTLPAPQQITVTASAGSVPFSITTSAGSSSWLGVSPLNSTATANTPAVLNVSVSPSSLPTGRQAAQIMINPAGGGAAQVVNVVFVISTNPFLTLSNTQLTFSAPFGGSVPNTQSVTVGSTGGALNFSVSATSDQNWLSLGENSGVTGTQTGALGIGVSASVLPTLGVGTYKGTITVTPSDGDPYTLQITATLTVGATSQVTAAPQSLYFSFEIGQAVPQAQTITLNTSGPSVSFAVATALNGSNPATCGTASWLSASAQQTPLATPNLLTVTVNTAGMTAGTCLGTVKITYASATGNAELDVPVTLYVATSALLNISVPQAFGVESATLGGTNITRQISLTSSDGTTAIQYSVGFQSAPCAWLFAAPISGGSNGTTPTPVQVNILPACIANPGTYQGNVTITSANLPQPAVLQITLVVNSNVQISVTPQALTFQQSQNGPLPDPQKLTFTVSGGNAPFIATASTDIGNWLQVQPGSGSTSAGFVTVSILANSL